MTTIALPPRAHSRQPRHHVELNRNHPLAKGLAFAAIGGMPYDYAARTPMLWNGDRTSLFRASTPSGVGFVRAANTTTPSFFSPQKNLPDSVANLSVFALITRRAGATEDMWYSRESSFSDTWQWNFGAPPGQLRLEIYRSADSWRSALGATTLTDNVAYAAAGTYDGTDLRVYLNGREDGTGAWPGTIAASSTLRDQFLMHSGASSGFYASSPVHLLLVWPNRTLKAAEVAELSRRPWQLFRPLQQRIFSVPTTSYLTARQYPDTTLTKIPSWLVGDHTYVDEDSTTPDGLWIKAP